MVPAVGASADSQPATTSGLPATHFAAAAAALIPSRSIHPAISDCWSVVSCSGVDQVVMLVVDGLGWNQLQARLGDAPPD